MERGWTYATLMFGKSQIRSGHLLFAILKTAGLRNTLLAVSREFLKVKPDALAEGFAKIVGGSPEDALAAYDGTQLG